jgi:phosphoribosylformylglycinamidine (FGAM) synthase-like amidotransferase family enzyme
MQFIDHLGYPTIIYPDNPYGSQRAVASMSSPNGKILGLFTQPELAVNVKGEKSLLKEIIKSIKNYYTGGKC